MVTGLLWHVLAGVASLGLMCVLIFVSTEVLHEHEKSSEKGGGSDAAYRVGGSVDTGSRGEVGAGKADSTGSHSDLRRGAAWVKNVVPIHRWRHPSLESHLWGFLQGFAEILDGIVTLSTLAFFGSGFEMAVARKRSLSYFRDSKRARDSEAKKDPNLV